MTRSLSRGQAAWLGLVVLTCLFLAGAGLTRLAANQGWGEERLELAVCFPELNEVRVGTPVRIRGIDAGEVVALEEVDSADPSEAVTVRVSLLGKYGCRLYNNATARIATVGLLGAKVIAIHPGDPSHGPLQGPIHGSCPRDLAQTVERLQTIADETQQLLGDIRRGQGTLGKLLQDDELYQDLKGLAKEARGVVQRTDQAVTALEKEIPAMKGFVRDGQETLRSIRTGADAIQRLPVIRGYVEDVTSLLVRPSHQRHRLVFAADALFPSGSAVLTAEGREQLRQALPAIMKHRTDESEIVVACFHDPSSRDQTSESALALTRSRSEAVVEYLRAAGVHRTSFWKWNVKLTPVGLGFNPSPVVEPSPGPASRVEVLTFTPP